MPVLDYIEYRNKKIDLDDEGFLVHYDDWDENLAGRLAEREGMGYLTPDKISMLKFIREYYERFNFFPMLSSVCKNVHKPKDCVNEEFYSPLLAWKLAGLPRPEEPVKSYLEDRQTPG